MANHNLNNLSRYYRVFSTQNHTLECLYRGSTLPIKLGLPRGMKMGKLFLINPICDTISEKAERYYYGKDSNDKGKNKS